MLTTNSSDKTTVKVRLAKGDGSTIGENTYTLDKLAQTQINGVAGAFKFTGTDTNLTAFVTVTAGGPVVVGASVIDNAISSISYSPPSKVFLPNNGAFGLILDDNGYGFSGRLEIFHGVPDYISAGIVVEGCSGGPTVFIVQGFATTSSGIPEANVTFTRNTDGSFAMSGDDRYSSTSATGKSATYTGTVNNRADGTIFGTITYTRLAGTECAGKTATVPFSGSRGVLLQ
jgi:hypothetical protein